MSLERQVFRSRRSRIALYVLVFAVGVAYGLLSAIAATGWWI